MDGYRSRSCSIDANNAKIVLKEGEAGKEKLEKGRGGGAGRGDRGGEGGGGKVKGRQSKKQRRGKESLGCD